MKSLTESLATLQHIFEAYDHPIVLHDFNEILGINKQLKTLDKTQQTQFIEWLTSLYSKVDPEDAYIFCNSSKMEDFFKIPRYLASNIDSSAHPDWIVIEKGKGGGVSTDRIISIQKSKGKPVTVAKTGNGSLGRVTTREQEMATCLVWNAVVSELEIYDDVSKEAKKMALGRNKDIKIIIKELSDTIANDSSWVESIRSQINAIREFLENRGLNWLDYRMCRYGSEDYISDNGVPMDSKTGAAHEQFVNAYMKMIQRLSDNGERVQKDNFDPSDVILYRPSDKTSKIFTQLVGECEKVDSTEPILEKYREMYANNTLFGISLKKCNGSGKYEVFNISSKTSEQAVKIDSVEKVPGSTNQCQLKVTGKFNLAGVSDPENPEQDIQVKDILITLRSFGSSNGMDVKELSGPAIGKVPVRDWRSKLGVDDKDLQGAIKVFDNYINKEHWSDLGLLIQAGMKNGPWCLPFVLIH